VSSSRGIQFSFNVTIDALVTLADGCQCEVGRLLPLEVEHGVDRNLPHSVHPTVHSSSSDSSKDEVNVSSISGDDGIVTGMFFRSGLSSPEFSLTDGRSQWSIIFFKPLTSKYHVTLDSKSVTNIGTPSRSWPSTFSRGITIAPFFHTGKGKISATL
jgi:hypothetical protein